MRLVYSTVLFAVFGLLPSLAAACPNCAVGREAREQVFGPEFFTNLSVSLLPFALIAAVCLRMERIGKSPRLSATQGHAE